ncbi:hypothetical protein SNL152K_2074 [Streptomyces sp. NL15-2K]|nr:hypothetical protein SNL152K_2074 [Streptomyces sp. NL15-2K]
MTPADVSRADPRTEGRVGIGSSDTFCEDTYVSTTAHSSWKSSPWNWRADGFT